MIVFGQVDPPVVDQRVVVDVAAPSGRTALAVETTTTASGTFQVELDLRAAVSQHGAGTYTVQAAIVNADELDDAESNVVQFPL